MQNLLPVINIDVTEIEEEGRTRLSLRCEHKGEEQSVAMVEQKPLQELALKDVLRMLRCACEFLEAQCSSVKESN
jgi:hypothetical protein